MFAEALELKPTASTTEGPFCPDKMPLDTDNGLLIINDAITPAVGEMSHLRGSMLAMTGQPVRNSFVDLAGRQHRIVHAHGRASTHRP